MKTHAMIALAAMFLAACAHNSEDIAQGGGERVGTSQTTTNSSTTSTTTTTTTTTPSEPEPE